MFLVYKSILFWNCRGAESKEFLRHAWELIRVHKLDVLIIAEPRISGDSADKVIRKLKFDEYIKVDARYFSGGIWIMWRSTIGEVQIFDRAGQFISVLIKNGNGLKWALTVVYASPTPSIRELFWKYLIEFEDFDFIPWLLIGDFNQILSSFEKQRTGECMKDGIFCEVMTQEFDRFGSYGLSVYLD